MGLFSVLDISAAGLKVQQTRLEVTATNLANSRTTAAAGTAPYRPLAVVVHSTVAKGAVKAGTEVLPRPEVVGIVEANGAPSLVYDPGHPDANAQGFVTLPGVDPIASMVDVAAVSRSYEANLRVFDVTRSLLQRLLALGSK